MLKKLLLSFILFINTTFSARADTDIFDILILATIAAATMETPEASTVDEIKFNLKQDIRLGLKNKQFITQAGLGYDFINHDEIIYIRASQHFKAQFRSPSNGVLKSKSRDLTNFKLNLLDHSNIDYQLNFNYGLGSRYFGYFGVAYDSPLSDKFTPQSKFSLKNNTEYTTGNRHYIDDPSYLYGYYISPSFVYFSFHVSVSPDIRLSKKYGDYRAATRMSKVKIQSDKYNYYLDTDKYFAYKSIPKKKYNKVNSFVFGWDWEINSDEMKNSGSIFNFNNNPTINQNVDQKNGLTMGFGQSYLQTLKKMDESLDDFSSWIPSNNSDLAGKATEKLVLHSVNGRFLYYSPDTMLSKFNVFGNYTWFDLQTPRMYYNAFKSGVAASTNVTDAKIVNRSRILDISTETVWADVLSFSGAYYNDSGSVWAYNKDISSAKILNKLFYFGHKVRGSVGCYFNNIIIENDSIFVNASYYYEHMKFGGDKSQNHSVGLGLSYTL